MTVNETFRTTKEKSPRCKEEPFEWTWQNITNKLCHSINESNVCLLQPFNPSIDDDSKGVFIERPLSCVMQDVFIACHSTMGCWLNHLGAQKDNTVWNDTKFVPKAGEFPEATVYGAVLWFVPSSKLTYVTWNHCSPRLVPLHKPPIPSELL